MKPQQEKQLWQEIVDRVSLEWRELPDNERSWVEVHARRIAALQGELHRYFLDVGGARICRDCSGSCCGHGKFHPNLANLLTCLVLETIIPTPDYSKDCPYIGESGCLFSPETRPYNCISFICELIEERLDQATCAEFYRLEQEIRKEYQLFAERYVGGGMRGILIRGELLPSYLGRKRSPE